MIDKEIKKVKKGEPALIRIKVNNLEEPDMMLDTNYLYNTLIKDIYSLGVVLGRKYKLIRLAYNVFMIGIIVSVLAFGIAALVAHK
jgi:hypothetical protein